MNPQAIYAVQEGRIFDIPSIPAAGRSGNTILMPSSDDWIEAPFGTDYFLLPDHEYGNFPPSRGEWVVPVAAFLPPGYVRLYLPSISPLKKWEKGVTPSKKAGALLPQFAYCAAGWHKNSFVVTAQQVDYDPFWDPAKRDPKKIQAAVKKARTKNAKNRLLRHLSRCALEYNCYTAQNIFLCQGEGGIPVSSACNARCAGCISFQADSDCPSSHQRISFTPAVDEIVGLAVPHLEKAREAIISFGQGCEGEPTLQDKLLLTAITDIRRGTARGTVHINTNGSRTETITKLAAAGLNSVRISMNSAKKSLYEKYYRPKQYRFEDVIASVKAAKRAGLFVSINLLVFPGVSDRQSEADALLSLINKSNPDLIQLRNLNIDPDLYMTIAGGSREKCIGLKNLIRLIKETGTQIGYFNKTVGVRQKHRGRILANTPPSCI